MNACVELCVKGKSVAAFFSLIATLNCAFTMEHLRLSPTPTAMNQRLQWEESRAH